MALPEDLARRLAQLPELRGWTVAVAGGADATAEVELRHPLLTGTRTLLLEDVSDEAIEAWRKVFLRSPEFGILNAGPNPTAHPQLLAELRAAAAGYGWSFETFRQIAVTAHVAGALTDAEFRWLIDAGPTGYAYWKGWPHDKPAWRDAPSASAEEQYLRYIDDLPA